MSAEAEFLAGRGRALRGNSLPHPFLGRIRPRPSALCPPPPSRSAGGRGLRRPQPVPAARAGSRSHSPAGARGGPGGGELLHRLVTVLGQPPLLWSAGRRAAAWLGFFHFWWFQIVELTKQGSEFTKWCEFLPRLREGDVSWKGSICKLLVFCSQPDFLLGFFRFISCSLSGVFCISISIAYEGQYCLMGKSPGLSNCLDSNLSLAV